MFILASLLFTSNTIAQEYVGSDRCMMCHNNVNGDLGYNIWEEYTKSGHPYKLNPVDGAPPEYPENTSQGVPNPPPGTEWNDFAYVIGGYGWKARFVTPAGRVYTETEEVQYNLETEGWVAYHFGEDKKYNEGCFQCHTTGNSPEGSWNGVPEDSLGTFSEPGVRCEGCHGPGGDHVNNPSTHPPNSGDYLKMERCGECHQRGGATNAIPASGGYIKHHEQINEMRASRHGDMFTCASCHDAHIALRHSDAAGDGLEAIKTTCETCHPNKAVTVNGMPKSVTCVDCHMAPASKSAVGMQVGNGWRGDVKTHIFKINTDAVTKEAMFNAEGTQVALDGDGRAAVTMDFACLRCHQNEDVDWAAEYANGIHSNGITTDEYVGDGTCMICHDNVNENTGYNIYEEYVKTGHPYKLNPVDGAPPVYPENTSPGVPNPPPGTEWNEFAYVIGGYGWKARFVTPAGRVYTETEEVQYNLETEEWVAYHFGEDKKYNQGCFQCHTTGDDPEGSWNGVPEDSLGTFAQPGVRCEGCHGPGKDHISDPANVHPPNEGDFLKIERCGECHQRGGATNAIPASGGYIKHHEQINEMRASKHGDGQGGELTCATCHNSHIALRRPDAAGEGLSGINMVCQDCHSDKQVLVNGTPKSIDCVDCHMSPASKSAVGMPVGNGWRGDVKTHIFAINTDAVTKEAMFNAEGNLVVLDDDGLKISMKKELWV
jgi:hypothetical protein